MSRVDAQKPDALSARVQNTTETLAAIERDHPGWFKGWKEDLQETLNQRNDAQNALNGHRLELTGLLHLIWKHSTFIEVGEWEFNADHERKERAVWGMLDGKRHTKIGVLTGADGSGVWTSLKSREAFWDWIKQVVEF